MALKKSDIRAILKNEDSTSEEKLSEILNILHEEVDSVKDERDSIKEELNEAKAEINDLKASADNTADEWKEKYEQEHTDFEAYKSEQSKKVTRDAQEKAFVKALKEAGISEKMIERIVDTKKADAVINGIAFDDKGNVQGAEELSRLIATDYADCITQREINGAHTTTPPSNTSTVLTKEQIYETDEKGRYKLSTEQRQQALIKLNKGEQ